MSADHLPRLEVHDTHPDDVTREDPPRAEPAATELVLARLVRAPDGDGIVVAHPSIPGGGRPPVASSVVLDAQTLGRRVAVLFDRGRPERPIVVGLIRDEEPEAPAAPETLELDADALLLRAKRELTLRCGKASVTLTRAGKVLIRGAYLLQRSSGVNRIKGGSVQIN